MRIGPVSYFAQSVRHFQKFDLFARFNNKVPHVFIPQINAHLKRQADKIRPKGPLLRILPMTGKNR